MEKILLNSEKIRAELARTGKPLAWLARECNISPQRLNSWLQRQYAGGAIRIGRALGIGWRELIREGGE